MFNLYGIVAAILKMATGRNFSMSGIISGHHNLPTYEMSLKPDNAEFVRYCGGHFENGDRYKFFNVGTSLSTHISNFDDIGKVEFLPPTTILHKFNIVRFQRNFI
jgi:hypothetical protein